MKKNLLKISSVLLLLVFATIQLLPALHYHSENTQSEILSTSNLIDQDIVTAHEADCLVCSFIAHKQVEDTFNLDTLALATQQTASPVLNADYSSQLFERAVHIWTNKGPPTA